MIRYLQQAIETKNAIRTMYNRGSGQEMIPRIKMISYLRSATKTFCGRNGSRLEPTDSFCKANSLTAHQHMIGKVTPELSNQ